MLYTCLNLAYSSSLKAAAGIPKQHEHIYADKKLEAGSYELDGRRPPRCCSRPEVNKHKGPNEA